MDFELQPVSRSGRALVTLRGGHEAGFSAAVRATAPSGGFGRASGHPSSRFRRGVRAGSFVQPFSQVEASGLTGGIAPGRPA
jgi:hypothetical protein